MEVWKMSSLTYSRVDMRTAMASMTRIHERHGL